MTKPREKTREELQAEIEDGKKKIRQFENREKMLRQKLSKEERRTRSHRLIVRGAVFESIVPEAKGMTNEESATFLRLALTRCFRETKRYVKKLSVTFTKKICSIKYLVISKDAIGKRVYCEDYDSNTYLRKDGKYANTYEDSEIDNYLENVWYKQLSVRLQNAIDVTEIKQASYKFTNGNFVKQETGYNNEIYNKIYRHVYLFSTEELSSLVNMSNGGNVNEFIHHDTTWTRDSYQTYGNHVINLNSDGGTWSANKVENSLAIRPAFVIDLSKIDYTVKGTVNYK